MAKVTDPRFKGFNAAVFRSAIRSTMTMAAPSSVPDQATFRWTDVKTYNPQDPEHKPYSWTTPTSTSVHRADAIVPVAVQFTARPAGSLQTDVGEFDTSRAVITVLDVDYALILGADQVLLGQNTYDIQFVAPPIGLFEVTVYQIYAIARDES